MFVAMGALAIAGALATAGAMSYLGIDRVKGIARAAWMPVWVENAADLAYGPDPAQRLDVMRPRQRGASNPVAAVFHGGSWLYGSREDVRERVCRRFLAQGFMVFNVEYRRGIGPATEDASRALGWVFEHAAEYGGDPARVVVAGESAGGHLALMASFRGRAPRAVVNFYGAAEPDDRAMSPLAFVRPGLCPVLSIHGTADDVVPYAQSVRLTEKLRQAGGAAELFTIEGGRHGFAWDDAERAYAAVFDFLRRTGVL